MCPGVRVYESVCVTCPCVRVCVTEKWKGERQKRRTLREEGSGTLLRVSDFFEIFKRDLELRDVNVSPQSETLEGWDWDVGGRRGRTRRWTELDQTRNGGIDRHLRTVVSGGSGGVPYRTPTYGSSLRVSESVTPPSDRCLARVCEPPPPLAYR